ncbi:unnamed protein product, partial [Heterosigma akashiwo]
MIRFPQVPQHDELDREIPFTLVMKDRAAGMAEEHLLGHMVFGAKGPVADQLQPLASNAQRTCAAARR